MPAACAVEMVHAYSLIHDDLPAMDDDDLRRGRPTCHKVFGEALAILAGDALLALAFEVLAAGMRAAGGGRRLLRRPGRGGRTVPVGRRPGRRHGRRQPGATGRPEPTWLLESIHRRKTGAMIRVSLRLGGMTAGAGRRQLAALDDYGRRLGLAFQITDDLLDVRSNEAAVGKRVGKDAAAGKTHLSRPAGRRRRAPAYAEAIDRRGLRGAGAAGPAGRRPGSRWPDTSWKGIADGQAACRRSARRATCKGSRSSNLTQLAAEMREAICRLAGTRTAHFASNLGVVELTLALHTTFDFSRDRLIWDTGHQVYPHKLITGRYDEFATHAGQGRPDGLSQPGRKRLRPVPDRPCRLQRRHRPWA